MFVETTFLLPFKRITFLFYLALTTIKIHDIHRSINKFHVVFKYRNTDDSTYFLSVDMAIVHRLDELNHIFIC